MKAEIQALDASPSSLTLTSGLEVDVLPMKTIQLIRLLKIFTNGMPPSHLTGLMFTLDPEDENFSARLAMNLIMAIPNAEAEVLEFLRSMLRPHGMVSGKKLSSEEKQHNQDLLEQFRDAMDNPHGLDTIDIVAEIISGAAEDLRSLGKRLVEIYQKMAASHLPKISSTESGEENSSED